ncbi:MAG: trigger factor [Acutalibacteraceae bacterium]
MELKSVNLKETNIYELEVSIDGDTFAEARKKAYAKAKKDIVIPGFRKGKVPMKMIESRYGEGFFYEDALEICYPEAAEAAIKESELKFIAVNNVDVKKMDNDGIELVIEITVKPEVEIEEYKLLKATQKKVEVTDEEVDAEIEKLRERNSRIEAVEGRNVENGDIVTIDFEGFVDGVAFEGGKAENYDLTIGSGNFIPGFEDQLIGHAVDEEFDIDVTFPEEYGSEELAGKASVFKIKIHEIKVKVLPEVDDDFAQEVSEFDTVDELKKDIAENLKKDKTEENESEIRKQLLDKLAENLKAEIPAVMVENEIDNQMNDMNYRLSMQGLSLDMYLQYMGMAKEDYREQLRENADKSVKIRLALEKIAELENLEVTEEDYEKLYKDYSEQYQMSVEDVKKAIPEDAIKGDLLVEKAIKLVRDNAKVTTSRKKKAAKADEAKADEAEAE